MTPPRNPTSNRSEAGFTLVEILVSLVLTLIISLVAFTFLEFTTRDVARTTERVHVDQGGRTALERLMVKLHSGCVAAEVTPIRGGSSATVLRFVSEHGEAASLPSVTLHEIVYTPASGSKEGTLVENYWKSTSASVAPKYLFNEASTPTTVRLLIGIRQTTNSAEEPIPIFQYYRYYNSHDSSPEYGEIDPSPLSASKLTEEEGKTVAKVTIDFTLAPEGKEASSLGSGRPVAFEDSAILRLAPSSTSSEVTNLPCAS
jgi:prepilin-type N-terminal cleavage/methylation domain-containing protein